jgi:hypothetical protein
LVAETGVPDPVDAIRGLAQELVTEAEVKKPPVDLNLLGSFRGVATVEHRRIGEWGLLLPLPGGGYRIVLNDRQGKGRARFSHAHEIGHTLLPSYRRSPKARRDAETGMYGRDAEEEYLCDVAASELLMPASLFRPFLATRPVALATVTDIADTFEVSLEAAGIRLVEDQPSPCAIIFWEERLKPSQARDVRTKMTLPGLEGYEPKPKLRIRFGVCSAGMQEHFFAPSKSIEDGSPLCECLDHEGVVRALCDLPTGSGLVPFETESVSAPYRVGPALRRRVITVARPAA